MSNTDLIIKDGLLVTPTDTNHHIDRIEIIQGDDDYNETDNLCVERDPTDSTKLITTKRVLPKERRTECRQRYEPSVNIYFSDEQSEGSRYVLRVVHHKGNIHIDRKKLG